MTQEVIAATQPQETELFVVPNQTADYTPPEDPISLFPEKMNLSTANGTHLQNGESHFINDTYTDSDKIAFAQYLKEAGVNQSDIIVILLAELSSSETPLSRKSLLDILANTYPTCEPKAIEHKLFLGARRAVSRGHKVRTGGPIFNTWNYLEQERETDSNIGVLKASEEKAIDVPEPSQSPEELPSRENELFNLLTSASSKSYQTIESLMEKTNLSKAYVNKLICDLRKKLPPGTIHSRRLVDGKYKGYWMGEDTEEEIDELPIPVETKPIVEDQKPEPVTLLEDEYASPYEIKNPIEKRVQNKLILNNKPKLVFTPLPDTDIQIRTQIEIPGKGKTKTLLLTRDEAFLFNMVFSSSVRFTREGLELKMVDIARSNSFETAGGFENVFNSLNEKIRAWKIILSMNQEAEVILSEYREDTPITKIEATDRKNEIDELARFQGKQRRRQPSHGKLKL